MLPTEDFEGIREINRSLPFAEPIRLTEDVERDELIRAFIESTGRLPGIHDLMMMAEARASAAIDADPRFRTYHA